MLLALFYLRDARPSDGFFQELAVAMAGDQSTSARVHLTAMGCFLHLPVGPPAASEPEFQHTSTADGKSGIVLDGYFRAVSHDGWERLTDGPIQAPHPTQATDAVDGTYNCLEWNATSRTVRLVNDQLGFRCLYYWLSPRRSVLVVASNLSLIRPILSASEPDWTAVIQELLLSATLDGRSLIRGVQRLLPGSDLTISQTGITGKAGSLCIPWGDKYSGLNVHKAAEQLVATGSQVMRTWVDNQSMAVSLSGGYDSRFLALLGRSHRPGLRAITLGSPDWLDAELAIRFCDTMGIPVDRCTPPHDVAFREYAAVVRMVEHVSDYLSPSWLMRYAEHVGRLDRPILNGFLGGQLSGSTGTSVQAAHGDWSTTVQNWYASVNSRNVPLNVLRQVCVCDVLKAEAEAFQLLLAARDPTAEHPLHRLCSLELNVRQFGFVSLCTYNLFRKFSRVLVPFLDRRLVEFFANIHPHLLVGQKAYRAALQLMDKSGIPYASGSAPRTYPISYVSGPQAIIYNNCLALSSTFVDYIQSHRGVLGTYFNVDHLCKIVAGDCLPTEGSATVPQRLMLVNAAILLVEYCGGLTSLRIGAPHDAL